MPRPVAVTTTFDDDNGGYGKRLTAVRDAKNQKTGYVYNPWGRLAAKVIYEGTTSHTVSAKASYHYDAMGRVLAATSFSRIPTTFEYDDFGRLKVKQIWNNDPLIQVPPRA